MSILLTALLCFHTLFILHKSWIAVLRTGLLIWLTSEKKKCLFCQHPWKRLERIQTAYLVTPTTNWFSIWSKVKGCWSTLQWPLTTQWPLVTPGHVAGKKNFILLQRDTTSWPTAWAQSHSPKPQPSLVARPPQPVNTTGQDRRFNEHFVES